MTQLKKIELAGSRLNVLIGGETGTGIKELVAKAIHGAPQGAVNRAGTLSELQCRAAGSVAEVVWGS